MLLAITIDDSIIRLESRHLTVTNDNCIAGIVPIAYDISDAKRLKKISRLCLDYGIRVQYSIFEFDLPDEFTQNFLCELEKIIDPAVDNVMVVPICENCRKHIHLIGKAEVFTLPNLFLY